MVQEGVGTAQEMLEAAEKEGLQPSARKTPATASSTSERSSSTSTTASKSWPQSGNDIPGLSTGLHDLDKKINGLNKSDLLLIAARPGMGKTSMALNVALTVAKSTE